MKWEIQSFVSHTYPKKYDQWRVLPQKSIYVFYHKLPILSYCFTCFTSNGSLYHKSIIVRGRNITRQTNYHRRLWKSCLWEIIRNYSFFKKKNINKKLSGICKGMDRQITIKALIMSLSLTSKIFSMWLVEKCMILATFTEYWSEYCTLWLKATAAIFDFRGGKKYEFINEIWINN